MFTLFSMLDAPVQTAPSERLKVIYRADVALTADEDARLRRLLFGCFPHAPSFLSRRFLRQCPSHRWLVFDPSGELVAHAAVHEKIVGTARGEIRVGGVAEVCVSSRYRGRGLVKRLLNEIHDWLRGHGFAFAMLFGQPHVYKSSGYALIENDIVSDNALARHWNPFCGKPMIRLLREESWPEGRVDLRGPTF